MIEFNVNVDYITPLMRYRLQCPANRYIYVELMELTVDDI